MIALPRSSGFARVERSIRLRTFSGMGEGQFLGDHPTHRMACDVDVLYADLVQQPGSVLGHLADAVGTVGGGTASHAPVVKGNYLEFFSKRRCHLRPDRQVAGKTCDQQQRLAGTFDFVVDVDAVCLNLGICRFLDFNGIAKKSPWTFILWAAASTNILGGQARHRAIDAVLAETVTGTNPGLPGQPS